MSCFQQVEDKRMAVRMTTVLTVTFVISISGLVNIGLFGKCHRNK
jgi:hypothetical protein